MKKTTQVSSGTPSPRLPEAKTKPSPRSALREVDDISDEMLRVLLAPISGETNRGQLIALANNRWPKGVPITLIPSHLDPR